MKILIAMSIIVLVTSATYAVEANAFNISEITEKYNQSLWWVGKNISVGDVYNYEICDHNLRITGMYDPCYNIELKIIGFLQDDNIAGNEVIITQANIISSVEQTKLILLISESNFTIESAYGFSPYTESIEKSLFYLNKFTNIENPKKMSVGDTIGKITTYYGNTDIRVNSYNPNFDLYELGYTVIETTEYQINKELPFPVSGLVYDSSKIYPSIEKEVEFKLTSISKAELPVKVNIETELAPKMKIEIMPTDEEVFSNSISNIPDSHLNEVGLIKKHNVTDYVILEKLVIDASKDYSDILIGVGLQNSTNIMESIASIEIMRNLFGMVLSPENATQAEGLFDEEVFSGMFK